MPGFTRREFFIGSASGAAGVVTGMAAYRYLRKVIRTENLYDVFPLQSQPSYSHSGEDIIAMRFLNDPEWVKSGRNYNPKPTYLDIGAADPVGGNNTYLFYMMGGRGVLVEPNIDFVQKIKARRPGDIVLNVGVGVTEQKEADYYCFSSHPAWNTFDKEVVDRRLATANEKLSAVIKMPLVPINRIIEEHFHGKAPDFLSTDVEGLDLAILKTLDFQRFRPKVLCVETIEDDLSRGLPAMNPEITRFLSEKGYEARGMTNYNTIYVDKQLLPGGRVSPIDGLSSANP